MNGDALGSLQNLSQALKAAGITETSNCRRCNFTVGIPNKNICVQKGSKRICMRTHADPSGNPFEISFDTRHLGVVMSSSGVFPKYLSCSFFGMLWGPGDPYHFLLQFQGAPRALTAGPLLERAHGYPRARRNSGNLPRWLADGVGESRSETERES